MNFFLEDYYIPLLKSSILLVVLFLLRAVLKHAVRNFTKKIERLEHRTGLVMKHVNFVIFFMVVLGLVFIWGVDFKNVGVVMSSVFAVIGIAFFAQWSILSNVTSGIIMFFTFPYKIGDYIVIHDSEKPCEGFIEDIRTFHVILQISDAEIITYPNSMMLQRGVSIIKNKEHFHSHEIEIIDKNKERLPHD